MVREIDFRTIKVLIGSIALFLGGATNYFAGGELTSISYSYCTGGRARDVFIGCLFAIAAFMWAHNGRSYLEKIMSKVASMAALGVALLPTACSEEPPISRHVWHLIFAATMFSVLAWFCYSFFKRSRKKKTVQAKFRSIIYAACGVGILGAMAAIGLHAIGWLAPASARVVFYGEEAALILFGISWLTASHVLPLLNSESERFKLDKPVAEQPVDPLDPPNNSTF